MIFKDDQHPEDAMYNNFRVFGTGLLCVMGMCEVLERKIE